ncbi:MAG: hypothetical protein JJV93_02300 [Alphaproteobacteria bacterium]|nr:hypothetical protein [Alphaproteobacteria bacterium]
MDSRIYFLCACIFLTSAVDLAQDDLSQNSKNKIDNIKNIRTKIYNTNERSEYSVAEITKSLSIANNHETNLNLAYKMLNALEKLELDNKKNLNNSILLLILELEYILSCDMPMKMYNTQGLSSMCKIHLTILDIQKEIWKNSGDMFSEYRSDIRLIEKRKTLETFLHKLESKMIDGSRNDTYLKIIASINSDINTIGKILDSRETKNINLNYELYYQR